MTYNERRLQTIELQNKLAKEQRKWQNQNLKETLLFSFIASFIVVLSIYALNLQLGQAVDKCSVNHDINYCESRLK
jgi:hypothetical protein